MKLDAGQRRAYAEARAVPKREVGVGLTGHIEAVGIIESTLVMVGGAKVQHHSVAGPHRHAANLNVGSRIARQSAAAIPSRDWARWAAQLAPTVAVDAVVAWLDAGRPDREEAADRIGQVLAGIIQAAQPR